MRVLFAAGGTAGHIVPALSIAEELKRSSPEADIVFVGAGREMEAKLLAPAGYKHLVIPFVPALGSGALGKLRMLLKFPGCLLQGERIFSDFKPDCVIGFGGYMSVIPLLVAKRRGIAMIVHEQNASMGVANRLLSRFAVTTYTPPEPEHIPPGVRPVELPLPVREVFLNVPLLVDEARRPTILILGGSQGAVGLNSALISLTPLLKELNVKVIHQAGMADAARVAEAYRANGIQDAEVFGFHNAIWECQARADLVIARAGAMTTWENVAAGRPTIFVPLPISLGHQARNVEFLRKQGLCDVVAQGDERFTGNLERAIRDWLADPARRAAVSRSLRQISSSSSPAAVVAREIARLAARSS